MCYREGHSCRQLELNPNGDHMRGSVEHASTERPERQVFIHQQLSLIGRGPLREPYQATCKLNMPQLPEGAIRQRQRNAERHGSAWELFEVNSSTG